MYKTALIVSHQGDLHAEVLMSKARTRGIRAVLWDVSQYPRNSEVSLDIPGSPLAIQLSIGGVRYNSIDISGVWWRRPGGARKNSGESRMQQYISVESEFVVRSMRNFLNEVNWISDPEATRLACRKPVQLDVALRAGFKIPSTCITNSQEALRTFLESLGERDMIMKPVGSAFMPLDPDGQIHSTHNRVVFTKVTDKALLLENISMVKNCPVIFQEAVAKDYDIRVTVVDDRTFAAAIRLEGCTNPVNLDWRNHEGERVYSTHSLPDEIRNKCVSLVARLGLRFGCIDLGFSEKEGYTFFEVNPQGQWLPSELQLGYTIADALLDSLTY